MIILFVIFICSVFIQCFFWGIITRPLIRFSADEEIQVQDQSVSVIIVFKNGKAYLNKLLPELLNQKYANYNIWFADDFSTDDGSKIIQRYTEMDDRIHYYKVKQDMPGKKQALKELIPLIDNDILLFTDIDCIPGSERWISRLVSSFENGIDIVLGYSPMFIGKGFVNMFSRFETFMTAIQYLSWALLGQPYMGVGRNLAYRRKLYSDKVYQSNYIGGDDDLFVQQKANAKNVGIQIHPESFMFTEAESDVTSFIRQKRRHVSTAHVYKLKHQIMLGLFGFSQIFFYPLAIILLLNNTFIYLVSIMLLLRLALYYFSAKALMSKLEEHSLFCRVFVLDLALAGYYLFIGVASLFKKQRTWN